MNDVVRLSHSQMDAFKCPARWHKTTVAGQPEAPSVHLIFGSALHAAIEAYGKGICMDMSDLIDVGLTTLHAEWHEADPHAILGEALPKLRERLITALVAFTCDVTPTFTPRAVELSFDFPLRDAVRWLTAQLGEGDTRRILRNGIMKLLAHVPGTRLRDQECSATLRQVCDLATPEDARLAVNYRGRVDWIEETPAMLIGDWKSSGKLWLPSKAENSDQVTAYLLASGGGALYDPVHTDQQVPLPPAHHVQFRVFAQPTPATCQMQTFTVQRSPQQMAFYLGRVARTAIEMIRVRALSTSQAEALAVTGPLCRFCGVLGSCGPGQMWVRRDGRGPEVPVISEIGVPYVFA